MFCIILVYKIIEKFLKQLKKIDLYWDLNKLESNIHNLEKQIEKSWIKNFVEKRKELLVNFSGDLKTWLYYLNFFRQFFKDEKQLKEVLNKNLLILSQVAQIIQILWEKNLKKVFLI